jgi:hypothetical protein
LLFWSAYWDADPYYWKCYRPLLWLVKRNH